MSLSLLCGNFFLGCNTLSFTLKRRYEINLFYKREKGLLKKNSISSIFVCQISYDLIFPIHILLLSNFKISI